MSQKYILSIDQGTSGTKALIFDEVGNIITKATEPITTIYSKDGYVEQDPIQIYESVLIAVSKCIELFKIKLPESENKIVSCGISNQRETFVLWDLHGEPLHNAVVWQCKRSVKICENLKTQQMESIINKVTGLTIDPYFSATKIMWLYENNHSIKSAIDSNSAYFGTIDTWLLFKLTGNKVYKSDYTNASRTLLFNIHDLQWDVDLLKEFNLDNLKLPEVTFSSDYFGSSSFDGCFESQLPITGMIGDSQAAFFGEGCFTQGMAKATLGTGCSILWNKGASSEKPNDGLLTTIGWSTKDQVNYAHEGVIVSCGSMLDWLKNQLGIFANYDEIELLASAIPNNEGVYLVPAFSGLGAPYWQENIKATIHGLTLASSKEHLVRATLESIAYQIKDIVTLVETGSGNDLKELKVNGGLTVNHFLMQYLADLLNKPISAHDITDISAWGAVLISGLGIGCWKNINDLPKTSSKICKTYLPQTETQKKIHLSYGIWKAIVESEIRCTRNDM